MATDGWITIKEVEDVHHALHLRVDAGRIAAALAPKTHITLPALIEYGCVRWVFPDLPMLPRAIQDSPLGRELLLINSPFGLRTSGPARPGSIDLAARQSEFMAFASAEDVTAEGAEFFKSRFWKSSLHVGFAKRVANYLAAGLHEMMTNAVQHSYTTIPMLAGYAVYPKMAQFAVVDVGQGVLAALRRSQTYRNLRLHSDAIRLALRPGVTSDPSGTGGFGFNDVFQALAEEWGFMRFRSGEACLVADGTGLTPEAGASHPVPPLPGFQVSVTCRSASAAPDHPAV